MRKLFRAGVVLSLTGLILWAEAPQSPFAAIDSSLVDLERITGLKPVHKVRFDTIDKPRLKTFLESQIKEEVKPSEIHVEELSLKKLGLVPQEFDLAKATVDLMTEQAAAFYDYRKKKLFLLEASAGASDQDTVLAHELAHALADQHFNLNKYLHRGKTDDSSLARMAVMEGQATWLMYEVQANKMGQSLVTSPAIVDMMAKASDGAGGQFPILESAPLYMRSSLLFPYLQGLRFQQAVVVKLGKPGFSEVFKNPPANSHQILHPEDYFEHAVDALPPMPTVPTPKSYRTLSGGTIGEFDHSVLLEQYCNKQEADELSPHWRSGAFELLEEKRRKNTVLLYASEWDTASSARRMFNDYHRVLKGKWKNFTPGKESANTLTGEGDDGFFRLELHENRVTSIEGLKDVAAANLR
jgi:hypothetical protein